MTHDTGQFLQTNHTDFTIRHRTKFANTKTG